MATIVTVPNEAMPAARAKINSNFSAINTELESTTSAVASKLDASQKGANNGVASLGPDGKVPTGQLPATSSPVTSVAGKTGDVALAKADVGLGNADNTPDTAKPVSTAQQAALDAKAPVSHTHTASQISDSTAAGRAMVTAADAAAQKTLLDVYSAPLNTITYGATTTVDFSKPVSTVSLTGNVTLASSNLAAVRFTTLRIICDGTIRTLAFPAGWKFVGGVAPTTLDANKVAALSATSFGASDSDVVVAYAAEL